MSATERHYRRKEFAVDPVAEGSIEHGHIREIKAALDAALKRRGLSGAFNYFKSEESKSKKRNLK